MYECHVRNQDLNWLIKSRGHSGAYIGTCIVSDRVQDSNFQCIDVLAKFIGRLVDASRLNFLLGAKGLSPRMSLLNDRQRTRQAAAPAHAVRWW